jgi:hypothetical protein
MYRATKPYYKCFIPDFFNSLIFIFTLEVHELKFCLLKIEFAKIPFNSSISKPYLFLYISISLFFNCKSLIIYSNSVILNSYCCLYILFVDLSSSKSSNNLYSRYLNFSIPSARTFNFKSLQSPEEALKILF